jgi:hypothetical protein
MTASLIFFSSGLTSQQNYVQQLLLLLLLAVHLRHRHDFLSFFFSHLNLNPEPNEDGCLFSRSHLSSVELELTYGGNGNDNDPLLSGISLAK